MARKAKGAYRDKRTGAWVAQIRIGCIRHVLGYFHTEEEACAAYQKAAEARQGKTREGTERPRKPCLGPSCGRSVVVKEAGYRLCEECRQKWEEGAIASLGYVKFSRVATV